MEVKNEYKITELGEIPNDWKVSRLGELADIHRGASPRPIKDPIWFSEHSSHGWVRIADVTKSRKYLFETKQYLSKEGILKSRSVKPGDLIMSICGTIGRPIIMGMDACIHDGFVAFETLKKDIDTEYLLYVLTRLTNYFKAQGQPGTQVNLNTSIVERATIPVPPIKEQQKIAEILSTVDKQIEQTDQLIEKTKELKKGLMQQLLTKGIGHKEFKQTELGKIPIDWTIKSLVDISKDITIGLVTSMTKNYVNNGVPLIRNSDIKEGFVRTEKLVNLSYDFAKSNKHKMLKRGDIVTIHTGDIGTSAVIEDNLIGALGFATLQTTALDNISPEWLMLFFNSEVAKKQFYNFSTGDGRNNLNLKEFIKTRIIVPNLLEEQNKISSIILSADEKIKGYEDEKSKYEELKKGLMQQLLTGKIRVKVD